MIPTLLTILAFGITLLLLRLELTRHKIESDKNNAGFFISVVNALDRYSGMQREQINEVLRRLDDLELIDPDEDESEDDSDDLEEPYDDGEEWKDSLPPAYCAHLPSNWPEHASFIYDAFGSCVGQHIQQRRE